MKIKALIMIAIITTGCTNHANNWSSFDTSSTKCGDIIKASTQQNLEFQQLIINKQSIDDWTKRRYELDNYSREHGCGTIYGGRPTYYGPSARPSTTYNYTKPYGMYRPSIIPSDYPTLRK